MNTSGASGKRSYYELLTKTTIQFELYQIALVLAIGFSYFYDSNALGHAVSMLMQWEMSKCTAEKLLLPTPYFMAGLLLVAYFLFRTFEFQPSPSDWRKIVDYMNEEEELTDFFTKKKVKRKRRLVVFKFGVLCLIAVLFFMVPALWTWYSSKCSGDADFKQYRVSFYEIYGALIFPSMIAFFARVLMNRGDEV